MPKLGEMAQLSRPFQIALVGVCLLAAVWFFALQGRSTSTGGSGSAPAVTASTPPVTKASGTTATHTAATAAVVARAKAEAKAGHIYHGPVPGLEGLTRDIARAHGAVAAIGASPSAAASTGGHAASSAPATVQHSSSSSSSSSSTSVTTRTSTTHTHTKTTSKAVTATPTKTVTKAPPSTAHKTTSASATASLSGQHAVEADLAKGDVVVLLFWNPSGTDDKSVHQAVRALKSAKHVAVQEAAASEVASFGSVTRGVQVYTTPTILVIAKTGTAIVLTGVQDTFAIEQAIAEARSPKPS
jgi:hypothetical protein